MKTQCFLYLWCIMAAVTRLNRPSTFANIFPSATLDKVNSILSTSYQQVPRDPYFLPQCHLLNLGCLPNIGFTNDAIEALERSFAANTEEIVRMARGPENRADRISKAREMFTANLRRILEYDIGKVSDGVSIPAFVSGLMEKVLQNHTEHIEPLGRAYLFRLLIYYGDAIRENINSALSATVPTVRAGQNFFEQFGPESPYCSNYGRDMNRLAWEAARIQAFDIDSIPVMTHALSDANLRMQLASGGLGNYATGTSVSFSNGRIFTPHGAWFEKDNSRQWVCIFDPEELTEAGLMILPDLRMSAKTGEKEVVAVSPIDFALCLGVYPIDMLDGNYGFHRADDNEHMLCIPDALQNSHRLVEFLDEKISTAF